MSGGVDSSAAAYLLKKNGFNVTGITMRFNAVCRGAQAAKEAGKACLKLKIPHHVVDFSEELEKMVIEKFVSEYARGRTPNPCVDCNSRLKFGILFEKAMKLGFDFFATGHYAKIDRKKNTFFLKKAKDRKKDQSYFLYAIKKESLKQVLFPLGALTKDEVREIAKKSGFSAANRPESQDICFIPERNLRGFLSERINDLHRGRITNLKGDVMGEHAGALFYTIGQRGGLGIGHAHPLYVLGVNTEKNRVIVGEKKYLKAKGFIALGINMLAARFPKETFAKIRFTHKEAKCGISRSRNRLKVIFEKPQEAITPGQSVVFYDNDIVLGGGVIEKIIGGVKWQ